MKVGELHPQLVIGRVCWGVSSVVEHENLRFRFLLSDKPIENDYLNSNDVVRGSNPLLPSLNTNSQSDKQVIYPLWTK